MNRPGVGDDQGEHCADCGRLDHQVEGLIIVDARLLGEAAKNPGRLVPFLGAIGVELVLDDPFAIDDIGSNGARDKIPGVVGDHDNKFFFHGMTLVFINEGSADKGVHQ
jgi:hypothetical protein